MADTHREQFELLDAQTECAVARLRFWTRLAILFERFWVLALPLVLLSANYAMLAWAGVFRDVPDSVRIGLGALYALTGLALLARLRLLKPPSASEIDRRIEKLNGLEHQPVAAQADVLAQGGGDPFAEALWAEHRARLSQKLSAMRAAPPRPDTPSRDPLALRALVAMGCFTAFAYTFGSAGGRLGDVFHPYASFNTPPPRIDAWATPPAYTRKPPVMLAIPVEDAQASVLEVPEGSVVSVRVTGGYGAPQLVLMTDEAVEQIAPLQPATQGQSSYEFTLEGDGALLLGLGEKTIAVWAFSVIPDGAPQIAFTAPAEDAVKQAANGALELTYTASDDYGVASAIGRLALPEADQGYRPLYETPELRLSLPASRAGAVGRTVQNLTDHPFAGRTLSLTLEATDAAGQTGASEARDIVLPARSFSNPLARAIAEMRQILALNADDAAYIYALLDAITLRPEDFIDAPAHMLALATIRTRLELAETDDEYRAAADYMWEVALGIENGNLSDAERKLNAAKQALRDALQNGASDEEIARRIEELREAMNDYLREFAENARRNPQARQQQGGRQQELSQRDLDRMLDQMRDLSEQGARAQAEQMLSELENMLNNLQAGRQGEGENGRQGQGEMQRQMNELGEILQEQQRLMDNTERARRDSSGEGEDGEQGEGQQGEGEDGGAGDGDNGEQPGSGNGAPRAGGGGEGQPGRSGTPRQGGEGQGEGQGEGRGYDSLGEGQRALADRLGRFMDGMRGMGLEPGGEFGEAQGEMGDAGEALGRGDAGGAVGDQADALDALRRGAQDMMQKLQEMQQQAGDGGPGGTPSQNGRNGSDDRDPLGRPRASSGPDFGESVKLPDEIDIQRAREILEAIRKRLGNAISPDLEKRYLERLLEFDR